MSTRYKEQLDRAKRYLALFRELDEGKIHDQASDHYDDIVVSFFQHCYHVKDWIKHDPQNPGAPKVEAFINATPELAICADICNASKHLTLDKSRSNVNPQRGGSHVNLSLGGAQAMIAVRYSIDTDDGPVDAFELATACIAAWDDFVANNV
jgi:hypothetical protein